MVKTKSVQIITPDGDIIEMRYGSTILDFAFLIHSELGLHCVGGIIKDIRYPKSKILEDGMAVKILTSDSVTPTKEWLDNVIMPKSRKEILKFTSK